jgi:hypothetical protein
VASKLSRKGQNYLIRGGVFSKVANLSLALFNIYINELTTILEKTPGISLHNSGCSSRMTCACCHPQHMHGLQQSLDLLEQYCQIWTLAVNPKILIFHWRSKSQGIRPKSSNGTKYTEYYNKNKLNWTPTVIEAMNELRKHAGHSMSLKSKNKFKLKHLWKWVSN